MAVWACNKMVTEREGWRRRGTIHISGEGVAAETGLQEPKTLWAPTLTLGGRGSRCTVHHHNCRPPAAANEKEARTCEVRSRGRGNTETGPKAEGVGLLGFKGANGDRWALPLAMAHEHE